MRRKWWKEWLVMVAAVAVAVYFSLETTATVWRGWQEEQEQQQQVNGTIVYLIQPDRLRALELSLHFLHKNFNTAWRYPVLLFHAPDDVIPAAFKQRVAATYPHVQISYAAVAAWGDAVPAGTAREGYKRMIYFWTRTIFHELAARGIEYYLRLDTDSFILSPITYDLLRHAKAAQIEYMYRALETDTSSAVFPALWADIHRHINESAAADPSAAAEHRRRLSLLALAGRKYSNRTYSNNFEVSRVALWRSEAYEHLLKKFRIVRQIVRHRLGDAPTRTLFLPLLVNTSRPFAAAVVQASDFAYFHGGIPPAYDDDDDDSNNSNNNSNKDINKKKSFLSFCLEGGVRQGYFPRNVHYTIALTSCIALYLLLSFFSQTAAATTSTTSTTTTAAAGSPGLLSLLFRPRGALPPSPVLLLAFVVLGSGVCVGAVVMGLRLFVFSADALLLGQLPLLGYFVKLIREFIFSSGLSIALINYTNI